METQTADGDQRPLHIQQLLQRIVSNYLIMDQVMKHLQKEDLLRLCFVNKLWLERARYNLNKRHKCEVIINGHQPCVTLSALNASLQDKSNIFYNGIKRNERFILCLNSCCRKYQQKSWSDNDIKLKFSNILQAIRFEYISLNGMVENCPFGSLTQIILKEKGQFLKELRINERGHALDLFEHCMYSNLRLIEMVVFDQLTDAVINNSMPNLQKIINTNMREWNRPKPHLVTCATIRTDSHPFFSMEQPPRWEDLEIFLYTLPNNFYNRLFWASTSICFTLKVLTCNLNLLTNLVTIENFPRFWALKSLSVLLNAGGETQDQPNATQLLQMLNFQWFAPKLYEFTLQDGRSRIKPRNLPVLMKAYLDEQKYQSLSTQKLNYFNYDAKVLENIFPNATYLQISDYTVGEIFEQTSIIPNLKHLHICHWNDTVSNLDFLLGFHDTELEEIGKLSIDDVKNLCIIPGPNSMLNRQDVKQISVRWVLPPVGFPFPTHVLSSGAGALIYSRMPGLRLDVKFRFRNPTYRDYREDADAACDNLRQFARVSGNKQDDGYRKLCYQIDFGLE